MSTKALREALNRIESVTFREETEARAELAAIEQAAKDLDRLGVGDGVYDVRGAVDSEWAKSGKNTWDHPDVKAWSDASVLLESIAEEAK